MNHHIGEIHPMKIIIMILDQSGMSAERRSLMLPRLARGPEPSRAGSLVPNKLAVRSTLLKAHEFTTHGTITRVTVSRFRMSGPGVRALIYTA